MTFVLADANKSGKKVILIGMHVKVHNAYVLQACFSLSDTRHELRSVQEKCNRIEQTARDSNR